MKKAGCNEVAAASIIFDLYGKRGVEACRVIVPNGGTFYASKMPPKEVEIFCIFF